VVVQHRQAIAHSPLVFARLDVPNLPVPSTYTNVQLRYPQHWLPLWQSFATRTETWMPDPGSCVALLLLALGVDRILAFLSMKPRERLLAALLLGFAAVVVPLVLWMVVLGCGFVTVVWAVSQREKISPARIVGVVAAALLVVVIVVVYALSRRAGSDDGSYTAVDRSANVATDTAVTDSATNVTPGAPPREAGKIAYQGLPAKFELPSGARTTSFSEQMLSPDHPQSVTLVLLSMTLVTWTAIALALVGMWLVWRERAAIKAMLRTRMHPAPDGGQVPSPVP